MKELILIIDYISSISSCFDLIFHIVNNDEPKKTEDFTDLDELDDVQQLDVLLEDVKLQLDDSKFPTSDEITDKEDLLEIEEFDNPKKLNELTVQQK